MTDEEFSMCCSLSICDKNSESLTRELIDRGIFEPEFLRFSTEDLSNTYRDIIIEAMNAHG